MDFGKGRLKRLSLRPVKRLIRRVKLARLQKINPHGMSQPFPPKLECVVELSG